jgi:hypothetical protein
MFHDSEKIAQGGTFKVQANPKPFDEKLGHGWQNDILTIPLGTNWVKYATLPSDLQKRYLKD